MTSFLYSLLSSSPLSSSPLPSPPSPPHFWQLPVVRSTYTLTGVQYEDRGAYRCVASIPAEELGLEPAELTSESQEAALVVHGESLHSALWLVVIVTVTSVRCVCVCVCVCVRACVHVRVCARTYIPNKACYVYTTYALTKWHEHELAV